MTRRAAITHEFVDYIPEQLVEGVVYASIRYATTVHLCCCGCGNEVVTPLSPAKWSLTFDGQTISLTPSIGNWSFDCQSHYWIDHGQVVWAPRWSRERIAAGRVADEAAVASLVSGATCPTEGGRHVSATGSMTRDGVWACIRKWLRW